MEIQVSGWIGSWKIVSDCRTKGNARCSALVLHDAGSMAESEGFDYLSFQQVPQMPTDSDYSQYPCGFQAYSYLPLPYTPVSLVTLISDTNGINGIIR